MLVGEIGTGKTTLVHSLLANGCEGVRIAFVTNPTLAFEEILRLIAGQLGFKPERIGKLELIQALDSFLNALPPHESVSLIFDEAQDLSDQTLEELRLLSNSQGSVSKPLQIVLVGQLELARRLQRPELRQLNQRIGARALLPTLRPGEVGEYADYRVRALGGDLRRLFRRGALVELVRHSGGIPRRINMLCHNALLLAYAQQARCVGANHMREAARDYDHLLEGPPASSDGQKRRWKALIKTAAALSTGIAALGLSYLFAPRALGTIETAMRPKVAAPPSLVRRQQVSEAAPNARHNSDAIAKEPQRSTIDVAMVANATVPDSAAARPSVSALTKAPPASASQAPAPAPAAPLAAEAQVAGVADISIGKAQGAPAAPVSAAATPPPAVPEQTTVVVQRGDTLSKIALRHKGNAAPAALRITVAMLIKSNPEIVDANHIYPGQIIRLKEASKVNLGDVSK
jgi:general secretion pathway protein A